MAPPIRGKNPSINEAAGKGKTKIAGGSGGKTFRCNHCQTEVKYDTYKKALSQHQQSGCRSYLPRLTPDAPLLCAHSECLASLGIHTGKAHGKKVKQPCREYDILEVQDSTGAPPTTCAITVFQQSIFACPNQGCDKVAQSKDQQQELEAHWLLCSLTSLDANGRRTCRCGTTWDNVNMAKHIKSGHCWTANDLKSLKTSLHALQANRITRLLYNQPQQGDAVYVAALTALKANRPYDPRSQPTERNANSATSQPSQRKPSPVRQAVIPSVGSSASAAAAVPQQRQQTQRPGICSHLMGQQNLAVDYWCPHFYSWLCGECYAKRSAGQQ